MLATIKKREDLLARYYIFGRRETARGAERRVVKPRMRRRSLRSD
jgi:hypothetical protein